jgi:hypothetical protein
MSDNVALDVTPVIDVTAKELTLGSPLETINDVLLHGNVSRKIEFADKINQSMYPDGQEAFKKYEKALIKSKVFGEFIFVPNIN